MIRTYGWLCFLLLLTHSPTLWAKAKDPAPQPLAFAIEGGVSMGAYEAGVVWGYVSLIKLRYERWVCEHNRSLDAEARRYCDKWVTKLRKIEKAHNMTLRSMLPVPYRLSSVSGASAGNANSLLAFLHWYKKGIGGVHHNILWDGWVPAGWTGLFPGKRTCAQYNKDMEESLNVMVNKVGLSPKDMHINCQPKKGVYLPGQSHARP